LVEERAGIARAERGVSWAFGADELYLRAGVELPGADMYDGFDQVENGVGSVRWLQQRIEALRSERHDWAGKRIGVVTGTAMAPLMPLVLEPLGRRTGAHFELIPVVNTLFGPSVTTAGLLPGTAVQQALQGWSHLDLALIPGESVNDDGLFIDSMSLSLLEGSVSVEVRPSQDFADALRQTVAA
jgi:NifB/MoaA-like Fe-S oxidoreductase